MQFVIPGLTRNPVPFWVPAGVYPVPRYEAGMTKYQKFILHFSSNYSELSTPNSELYRKIDFRPPFS